MSIETKMAKVIITGWREGFRKVELTHLQIDLLNIDLKRSKMNVDNILNDQIIEIDIYDIKIAEKFVAAAEQTGACCKLTE